MKKTRYLIPALFAVLLVGCNGQEDFGDPISGFIYDPTRVDPDFNASDECAPRVIGVLQAQETVSNVGYTCGGFFGYTGITGLDFEQEANYFVCPMASKTVTFFIGGQTERVELGTAGFRYAESVNQNSEGRRVCSFDRDAPDGGVYTQGEYDADGPYLFSIADLFDAPVRVDVVTDSEPNETVAENVAALLAGLDSVSGNEQVDINYRAHQEIFNREFANVDAMLDPAFFSATFSEFVMNGGTADLFLQSIEAAEGAGSIGVLPATRAEAEAALAAGNGATAAGLYRIDMPASNYLIGYLTQGTEDIFNARSIVTDYLASWLAVDASSIADDGTVDLFLLTYLGEFLPFVVVDRRQRIFGGGPFDVVDLSLAEVGPTGEVDGLEHICADRPLYLAMDASSSLLPDLRFSSQSFSVLDSETAGDAGGTMNIPGRFIEGRAFSNIASSLGFGDYSVAYGPSNLDHDFDDALDKTTVNSPELCSASIDDQLILSYARQGLVEPSLDADVMSFFFSTPVQYQLSYLSRDPANAGDGDPDDRLVTTMDITIHEDGSILTDIAGGSPDGNLGYDSSSDSPVIPAGEYVVGMVTSIYRGVDDASTLAEDESVTEAQMNIAVFNLAPSSAELIIPKYGSHFRARLTPDVACEQNNRLFDTFDGAVEGGDSAVWFDPKDMTDWFRDNPTLSRPAQYTAVRTRAYGVLEGSDTGCTP